MRAALVSLLLLLACDVPTVPHHDPPPPQTPAPEAPRKPFAIEDLERATDPEPADRPLAGAFRALDGRWRGEFHVYVDTRGQADGPARPVDLDPAAWQKPPYRKTATLQVEQRYTSESDYLQRVEIRDTMPDGTLEVSRGVNKVYQGRLWCLVRKPKDLVLHPGELVAKDTIIWRRDREEPRAIEWFRETVGAETYAIVGWGKYGDDDPAKAPRMFFHARYARVR